MASKVSIALLLLLSIFIFASAQQGASKWCNQATRSKYNVKMVNQTYSIIYASGAMACSGEMDQFVLNGVLAHGTGKCQLYRNGNRGSIVPGTITLADNQTLFMEYFPSQSDFNGAVYKLTPCNF